MVDIKQEARNARQRMAADGHALAERIRRYVYGQKGGWQLLFSLINTGMLRPEIFDPDIGLGPGWKYYPVWPIGPQDKKGRYLLCVHLKEGRIIRTEGLDRHPQFCDDENGLASDIEVLTLIDFLGDLDAGELFDDLYKGRNPNLKRR